MSDFDIRNPGSGGPPPLGQPNVAPSGGTAPAGTSRGVGATTNQVDPGVAPRQPAPASQGPTLEPASPSSGAALAAFYQQDAAAFEDVISEIRKDLVTADEQEWKSNRQAMMSAFQVVKDKLDDQISELRKSAKDTMAAALFSGIAQIAGGAVSVIGASDTTGGGSVLDAAGSPEENLARSVRLYAALPAIVAYGQRRRRWTLAVLPNFSTSAVLRPAR